MENRLPGSGGDSRNRANSRNTPRGNRATKITREVDPNLENRAETVGPTAPNRRSFYYYNSNSNGHYRYQPKRRNNAIQRRPVDQNLAPIQQSKDPRVTLQPTQGCRRPVNDEVINVVENPVPQKQAAPKKDKDKTRAQRKKAKREMTKEERESKKQRKIRQFNEFSQKYSHIPEEQRPYFILPNGIVLAEPPILYTTDRSAIETKPDISQLRFVALDCETVGGYVEPPKNQSANVVGRVSIVDENLECIYDKFVKARTKIWTYNTRVSGIREEDMLNGEDFFTVQKEVAAILNGKMVVGHSLNNDFNVLFLRHPHVLKRDTAVYLPLRRYNNGKTPSLKTLAKNLLNLEIQTGEHDSTVDARTSMQLYQVLAEEWEASLENQKDINSKSKILKSDSVWLNKSSYSRAECAYYKHLAEKQQEGSTDENEPTNNGKTPEVAKETKLSYRQRNKMNGKNTKPMTSTVNNGNHSNESYVNGITNEGNNGFNYKNGCIGNDTKAFESSKVMIPDVSTEDLTYAEVLLANDLDNANHYLNSMLKHMESIESGYKLNKKTDLEKSIATLNNNLSELTNKMKNLGLNV
ncbi:hypothetical protein JYU34_008184 [Plutella xylostella]|uniref:RNA exonuclease 4 n=1 Tax=Plutella xylostella TaxID=51655 RepID=A0ABQ7QNX6_PLUXY|nr:hypothetical protein JYU34_008184 [Plutella xylostella]